MRTLILVPTALEAKALFKTAPTFPDRVRLDRETELGLCGFGLAAAGILALAHIEAARPDAVLLCGIAGSHDLATYPIGSVIRADQVRSEGIGVGQGVDHRSGFELGFPEVADWPAELRLAEGQRGASILSVAAASANSEEARRRRARCPQFPIEDMETWSVALACKMKGLPLRVRRAISNEAGDRDKSRWRIGRALENLAGELRL